MSKILDIKNIEMNFKSKGICVRAVNNVSFTVNEA